MIGKLDKPIKEAFPSFDSFYNALKPLINQVSWYPRYRGIDKQDLIAMVDDTALDLYGFGLEHQKYDHTKNMSVENWFRQVLDSRIKNYFESKSRKLQPSVYLDAPIGEEEEGSLIDLIADPASLQQLLDVDYSYMVNVAREILKQKGKSEWTMIFDMLLLGASKKEIGDTIGWDSAKVSMNLYKIKEFLLRDPKFRSLFEPSEVERVYQQTLERRERGREELKKKELDQAKIKEEDIQRVF